MTKRADAVIVPTTAVKREVVETFYVNDDRIFVVPESARACFQPLAFNETEPVRRRLGIQKNFLLAVGTIEPRKNYEALISAFEEVIAASPEFKVQLVIVGERGWLSEGVFELLEKSPVRERIVVTGYLGDNDLRALYSSCRAFIYPSIHEGFGLPPLEAMSCGAPVIASNEPAVAEVTAGAARLVGPQSKQEITRAIVEVLRDEGLRSELIRAGRRRASQFSWNHTAALTLEVYREAAKRRGR
jgi:glycosyltransferase involved in cell wall biosynthesis